MFSFTCTLTARLPGSIIAVKPSPPCFGASLLSSTGSLASSLKSTAAAHGVFTVQNRARRQILAGDLDDLEIGLNESLAHRHLARRAGHLDRIARRRLVAWR